MYSLKNLLVVSNQTNTKVNLIDKTLSALNELSKKAWRATRMDKILNALNTILLIHNAAMLSNNLAQTLGEVTSQLLHTINIRDEKNNPLDINGQLSTLLDSWMRSVFGAENWTTAKRNWAKANRIISSTSNIVWTIRSMQDSAREIMEWTAENTGKIGNALKRFRVVGENAYKWMPERVTMTNAWTRKIDRFREGIDSLDDAASSLGGVLGEVQNIQQEAGQLNEQKEQFDKNIKDLTPKAREDNEPVKTDVTESKQASGAPANTENVFRGEGENDGTP